VTTPLVQVDGLVKHYGRGGWVGGAAPIRAVEGVSFTIARGETLGLVGESGSGKSTVGRAVLRLEAPTRGTVHFDGSDLAALGGRELRALRRRMQMVFQDPFGSLNPRRTIGDSIAEGLAIHRIGKAGDRRYRVETLLEEVGLDASHANRFPHEFSGGQRQRVGIARALAVEPQFMVCDEPVSALDVSIQAQVLNLLLELRDRHELSYLFIAHDLTVVRRIAHRVAVMYMGTIVEVGPAREVIGAPRHPYTRALASAIPRPDPGHRAEQIVLAGEPPSPTALPAGCPFEPRCFHPLKNDRCRSERPALVLVGGRRVACHHET
jgi:peptide/nickel transport system ATP-binding protein/oligopeptide transport system ATP-binding protein